MRFRLPASCARGCTITKATLALRDGTALGVRRNLRVAHAGWVRFTVTIDKAALLAAGAQILKPGWRTTRRASRSRRARRAGRGGRASRTAASPSRSAGSPSRAGLPRAAVARRPGAASRPGRWHAAAAVWRATSRAAPPASYAGAVFVNRMPRYEVLSEGSMAVLEEGWRSIVRDIGIEFQQEPALELFRKAGQTVEGDLVKLDPDWVLEQVAKAPRRVPLHRPQPRAQPDASAATT